MGGDDEAADMMLEVIEQEKNDEDDDDDDVNRLTVISQHRSLFSPSLSPPRIARIVVNQ